MTLPLRRSAIGLLASLLIAACTGGPGGPGPSASSTSPVPTASLAPASPTGGPSEPGGAAGGNPGLTPIPVAPGGPGSPGGPIQIQPPVTVTPVPNLLDVRDIRAESVKVSVASGGHLVATVTWWSGPSPCSELAEVHVERTRNAFTLTVREGAAELGIACPAIAMHKQAAVDLGPTSPGTYSVSATGADVSVSIVLDAAGGGATP
jgi:hypothetical protein